MKIKFKFIGAESVISATRDNVFDGRSPVMQPSKSILHFQSLERDLDVDIIIDERHRLAAYVAEKMKNNIFEFDFSPTND